MPADRTYEGEPLDVPGRDSGRTFTVRNIGTIGTDHGTAISNCPEVAVLAVGTVVDGGVVARPVVALSVTADQRVVQDPRSARNRSRGVWRKIM